jgi:phosphatidylinositol-3-phosphatase
MRLRSWLGLTVSILCLLLTLPMAPAAAHPISEGVPSFSHVFLIIGENTDYSHLKLSNAPYLLGTVRPESAWFTNFYATTHWSEANYVALVTGQFNPCEQADGGIRCHQNVDSLFNQLNGAGLTWKVWLDGAPGKCDGGGSNCLSDQPCPLSGFYTTGNPPILFNDTEGTNGVWSATTPSHECLSNDVPAGKPSAGMSYFNANLSAGSVANFNFVIPNGCNDGEGNCAPTNDRYTQYDNFLAREVPLIEASPSFGHNGVIIITYDEDQRMGGITAKNGFGSGGHTVCAILSPSAVPGNYTSKTYAYSLLRTLEDGFQLSDYLGNASAVSPLPLVWA